MDVLSPDLPLLALGVMLLAYSRIFHRNEKFQALCQFVGTFWGQFPVAVYGYSISLSIARITPFFSASRVVLERLVGARSFVPFVFYVIIAALIGSFFWDIPAGIEFTYGAGRVWFQLCVFIVTLLSVRGLASGLTQSDGPRFLWTAIMAACFIHSCASMYQYLASFLGLPLIGISRAHGQTLLDATGDIAAFEAHDGSLILRPGGLAGEPKTVAVIFGIFLISQLVAGPPPGIGPRLALLSRFTIVMSALAFVGTFSTSGFFGALVALVILTPFHKNKQLSRRLIAGSFIGVFLFMNFELFADWLSLGYLSDLIRIRTWNRLQSGVLDPPVEAALAVLEENLGVLLFGTGLGGGTFYIINHLGIATSYTLTPNIGCLDGLLEFGLVGMTMLLIPVLVLRRRAAKLLGVSNPDEAAHGDMWELRFLVAISLASLAFMFTGSGIPLGYVLAFGCAIGASHRLHHMTPAPPPDDAGAGTNRAFGG